MPSTATSCALGTHPRRWPGSVLASNLADVMAAAGIAERIPVGDGTADAAVVGNAFHHFDAAIAFAQIARVLRPAGALALFWARPAMDEPTLSRIERTIQQAVAQALRPRRSLARTVRGTSRRSEPKDSLPSNAARPPRPTSSRHAAWPTCPRPRATSRRSRSPSEMHCSIVFGNSRADCHDRRGPDPKRRPALLQRPVSATRGRPYADRAWSHGFARA